MNKIDVNEKKVSREYKFDQKDTSVATNLPDSI